MKEDTAIYGMKKVLHSKEHYGVNFVNSHLVHHFEVCEKWMFVSSCWLIIYGKRVRSILSPLTHFYRQCRHHGHFPRYWTFVRGIHRWPVTWSFDVFFDLRLNKRLSKQSGRWWFETSSRSLWRHCNASERFWTPWVLRNVSQCADQKVGKKAFIQNILLDCNIYQSNMTEIPHTRSK